MAIEVADFFDGLDPTLPTNVDVILEADNHLRLTKRAIKNVFPGATGDGFNKPITATETELSFVEGVTSNLQAQITALALGQVPVGGVIPYAGALVSVPSNYRVCDGNNGTPNLTDMFIYGAISDADAGDTGGAKDAAVVSHTHTQSHGHSATMADSPAHKHRWSLNNDQNTSGGAYRPRATQNPLSKVHTSGASATHGHTASVAYTGTISGGVTGVDANLPPFVKLAYIKRVS